MEKGLHVIFLLTTWIFFINGAPPSSSLNQESCVLSLTIPKDSIKSSCNMNEEVLRKMHSMEVQFNHYRTQVGSLEIRFPEIVLNMNRYNDKVEQLELVIAKESTYYKHMEERINTLEEAVVKEENTDSKKHINEPDTLLDPLRPYVMAELQQMKENLQKELKEEMKKEKEKVFTKEELISTIKPLILAEMQYVKQEIIKSLKDTMTIRILDQNEEIGSSDEIGNHIVEEITPSPEQEQVNMVSDKGVEKDETLLHEMARTLHTLEQNNVSIISNKGDIENLENNTKEIKNEKMIIEKLSDNSRVLTENLQRTIDILHRVAKENVAKDLNEKIEKLSSEIELKIDSVISKFDEKTLAIEGKAKKLEDSLEEIAQNFSSQNQKVNNYVQKLNFSESIQKVNKSVNNMKVDIQSMDRRIDSYTNDIVLDTKIQTKFENVKFNLDLSLMGTKSSLASFENKLTQVERQGNLSMTLLNHFKKTLVHNHNESNVKMENLQSEIKEMENNLKDEMTNKMNTENLEIKLEDLEHEFMFFKRSVDNLRENSTVEDRKLDIKLAELSSKTQSIDWQLTSLHDHAQRILEIERNQTLIKNNYDLMRELMKLVHLEQKLKHNRWIEFNFTHHSTQNACQNKQYVKRNHISKDGLGAYVGVQLCSATRYKLFLGNSLDEDFLDIGDQYGHGQDHCQFIGGKSETGVKVDTKFPSAMGEKGNPNLIINIHLFFIIIDFRVWFYDVYRHFQQYFSYIVVVSFIGGGKQSTRKTPLTCRKSLPNFIT